MKTDKDWIELSLVDDGGNRIRLTPKVIFHLLERFSKVEMGFPTESRSWVLRTLMAKEGELKLAESQIGKLVTAATADTGLLFEAVIRLDATKRFIKSDEALKVRGWLVKELLKRIPPDDPRRKIYAPATSVAPTATA